MMTLCSLTFPSDVLAVADHLGLDRFAVLGLSAGGGYALACACLIPERVSAALVVSGMMPVSRPEERRALPMGSRVLYRLAGPAPWLVQPVAALLFRLTIRALRRPRRPAAREDMGLPFPPDVLADPELRPLVIADLTEAVVRPGTRGLVDELALYARPWGFRLDQITIPVHLWHGDRDVSAPTALARGAAAAIPACHAVFVPGGHTAPFGHLEEILNAVRQTGQLAPRRAADQLGDTHELAGQSSLRHPAAPRPRREGRPLRPPGPDPRCHPRLGRLRAVPGAG
jgi:pimeloyl-ACP methyl ester carboxylesterase